MSAENAKKAKGRIVMKEKLCQMNTQYVGQPTTTITLELPVELLEYVNKTAALEGTDAGTIINCFVQQGLLNSSAAIKRLEFADHAKDVMQKHGIHQSAINEIFNKLLF